ncbi:amine sulfotransferase-like isoform X2 [Amphiura filiformis]
MPHSFGQVKFNFKGKPTEVKCLDMSGGHTAVGDIQLPWMVSQRALVALKDYDIRQDDIWVTTYPKAGTHWTSEIVQLILSEGHVDRIDRTRQPHPVEFDIYRPGGVTPPKDMPIEKLVPMYERCKNWPSPRVFMTHLAEHLMPKQIYEGKGKVIFVMRNPKDLAVSFFHFLHMGERPDPRFENWDNFFEIYCTDDIPYSSWFTYVLSFWKKHRYDENFLFLKFEEMKKDPRNAVLQVAHFLGKDLDDETIDRVVRYSSVDSMKERFKTSEKHSDKPSEDHHEAEKSKLGAPGIIRKGIVGDWKQHFTEEQSKKFDELFREKMEGSGLDIDFEI